MNTSKPAATTCRILASSIAVFLAAAAAQGAVLTWDVTPGVVATGDGAITGGSGTWNLTNGNWTADGGATNVAWVSDADPDVALFNGTAGTVVLGAGIIANGLTFDTAGYLLTGNLLTLGGATPTITANANVTLDTVLAGTAGMTKAGAAVLTLQRANTYAGGTTLSAGTLVLNHPNALGTGTFTIAGGTINTTVPGITIANNPQQWTGNFTFTGTQSLNLGTGAVVLSGDRTVTVSANTLTVGGSISGAGFGLAKSGAGSLVLSGINQYSGPTSVNTGTLTVSSIGNAGVASNLGTGSVINLGQGTTLGGLTYTGPGETTDRVLNWSGAGGGGQVFNNGTGLLRFTSNTTSTGSGAKGLFFGGSGNGQIDGTITNSGGLMNITKNGTGTWTLAGNLTLGAGNVTTSGGTLILGGTNVTTGAFNVNAGGRLLLAGSNTNTSNINVNAGGMIGGAGSTSGTMTMANNSTIMLNTGAPTTSIKVAGVTFNGTSTIGFDTAPAAGSYTVLNYSAGVSPNLTSLVGARNGFTLDTTDPNNQKILANVSVASRTWNGASGLWDSGTTTNWTEGDKLFFAGDTVTFNEPTDPITAVDLSTPVAPASVTINNSTNAYAFSGTSAIVGFTSVTKAGAGTATFATPNAYTGGTLLRAGTLIGQNNTAFGTGPITLGDAGTAASPIALRLIDSVDIANPITVAAGGTGSVVIGTVGDGLVSNATIFSGVLTLNRPTTLDSTVIDRLAINGPITGNVGTLTISGGGRTTFNSLASDFVGDVVITGAGTILQASVGSAAETIPNTSSVTVDSGAFLHLASNGGPETINGLNGTGTVRTFPTSAFGSTLAVGAANGNGDFAGSLINGNTALSLLKLGEGTQILSGSGNTYTGTTTVSGGALVVSGSVSGTTQIIVNSGAFRLGASNVINDFAALTLNGGRLETGGFSEGSLALDGLGVLSVTANSVIDFGTSAGSTLLFAGVGTHNGRSTLSIENWTGTPLLGGGADRLLFTGDNVSRLAFESAFPQADVFFNGIGGYATVQVDPAHFEVVAVPEPSAAALIGGGALLHLLGFRRQRGMRAGK